MFPEVSLSFVISSHAQIPCSQRKKKMSSVNKDLMIHESESARDSPYGLKVLEAIRTVSLPLSLSLDDQSLS